MSALAYLVRNGRLKQSVFGTTKPRRLKREQAAYNFCVRARHGVPCGVADPVASQPESATVIILLDNQQMLLESFGSFDISFQASRSFQSCSKFEPTHILRMRSIHGC